LRLLSRLARLYSIIFAFLISAGLRLGQLRFQFVEERISAADRLQVVLLKVVQLSPERREFQLAVGQLAFQVRQNGFLALELFFFGREQFFEDRKHGLVEVASEIRRYETKKDSSRIVGRPRLARQQKRGRKSITHEQCYGNPTFPEPFCPFTTTAGPSR
jgi:hypothetical protein